MRILSGAERLPSAARSADRLAREFVHDLPHLLDRVPPLREYETAPPEHSGEDGSLPIYELTPDRIRFLSEEEIAEKRRAAEEERSARYRSVYDDLQLSLTAHRDGTLEIRWVGGESIQGPEVLQPVSVSQMT
jgi:hypothetical protein